MIGSAIVMLVYWAVLVIVLAAATALAVGALGRKSATLVLSSAVLLAIALGLAAWPTSQPPVIVAMALGVLSLALAVVGGGPAASYVLAVATRGSVATGTYGGILVTADASDGEAPTSGRREEVMRGGLVIGLLERLAIGASLMSSFPGAFAVVIAVKGVGRFTELAASEARERFIIGTLASLIWATAAVGVWLLCV
ncbi:hypothetical protein SAMN04489806_2634 [Paramicrobacterium humi]|uniref:Uncharacterized protein n=1 Tax=Paramicrobacterium humi TaxID=640635 RepID=A0A1H4PW69_9MICO|nr:hypothetical protein [Microbacterium humi]SEC11626.1 hypothetical protein SAMN04489806_2634 [Microbacterium humi]